MLELTWHTLRHPNRFVREAGYQLLAAEVATLGPQGLAAVAQEVAEKLRDGLSDNWSQVS